MIARLIRAGLPGWRGCANLYRVDPPLEGNEFVVVSGVVVPFTGPETFIFGATEDGEAKSWSELPGSFQGAINHAEALRGAGYTVED